MVVCKCYDINFKYMKTINYFPLTLVFYLILGFEGANLVVRRTYVDDVRLPNRELQSFVFLLRQIQSIDHASVGCRLPRIAAVF